MDNIDVDEINVEDLQIQWIGSMKNNYTFDVYVERHNRPYFLDDNGIYKEIFQYFCKNTC